MPRRNFRPRNKLHRDHLGHGIDVPSQVLPTCAHAQPLPISTRGIGFAVSYTHAFLNRFRHFQMSIYQLYRASLTQFQVQLFEASEAMYFHQIIPKDYRNMHMNQKDRKFVTRETKNFKMIAQTINSFGPFEYGGIVYQPFLPETAIPNAFNITIANLRETVVALSKTTAETKQARWEFYIHNSIPGANWEVHQDDKNAVLLNPDEIIPENYDLCGDYTKFVDLMRTINQEYHNHMGNMTYSGKGDPCQLVCIKEQCKDRIPNNEILETKEGKKFHKHFAPVENELIAHAFGKLTNEQMYQGILCLYGEYCKNDSDYDTWAPRSELFGSSSIVYSWENVAFSILNNALPQSRFDRLEIPSEFTVGHFALPLPISTRGIGFAVSYIYTLLNEHYNLDLSIYQLFRASLLQFQYRIFKAAEYKFQNLVIPKAFFKMFTSLDAGYVHPHKSNFRLIATLINNYGPFEMNSVEYFPAIPQTTVLPNPFNVTIENLRETVVALSSNNPNTTQLRWKFYQHNSIPGAIWNIDEGSENAILTNPDDIMPAKYKSVDDLEALAKCMGLMQMKDSQYVGSIKYFGTGRCCQLLSISNSSDRIPSSKKLNDTEYLHYPLISQGILAHARNNLSTSDMVFGILGLYGEYCNDYIDPEIWSCRFQSTGSSSAPITLWKTLARYSAKIDIN